MTKLSHLSGAHVVNLLRENWKLIPKMFNGKRLLNQMPMGHSAHLNVQLWRLYSAKIL